MGQLIQVGGCGGGRVQSGKVGPDYGGLCTVGHEKEFEVDSLGGWGASGVYGGREWCGFGSRSG